jgi:hypothetical protein
VVATVPPGARDPDESQLTGPAQAKKIPVTHAVLVQYLSRN